MSALLAVDPSIRSAGVALFLEGRLWQAATIKRSGTDDDLVERCRAMARRVFEWADGSRVDELALEWPQIYRATRSKGDPNDLPALAGVCAAVAALYTLVPVRSYTPAEWAGQLPKSTLKRDTLTSPRTLRIASRLTPKECAILKGAGHDAIDAVGIGLHHLGRLAPVKLYPGATRD